MGHRPKRQRGQPAPQTLIDEVKGLLNEQGKAGAESDLGVNCRTLAWLVAGLPVLDGTVALVRQRIAELRKKTELTVSPEPMARPAPRRLALVPATKPAADHEAERG